ncbi:MAG: glycosyltransferase family 8 protein [Bacilli bacterium]|nr:glycosyltransferase family 8 protein [Bacilli bacterium]
MNILYTLNDKFVPQVGAGICSVCENNKDVNEITFYIVSYGITDKNKKELEKLVKKYKRKIEIIELNNINSYFDFDFDTTGWNPIVLARLLVDKLLPSNLDKVLYLDGDTIVRTNLEELYNCNMNRKIIGMSIEPTIDKGRIKNLKMGKKPYCNAGVLLIDLKAWRNKKAGNRIINYYKNNNGRLFANDQDAINGSMKDEIKIISPKYNYYNIFDQYSYRFLSKIMRPIDYSYYVSEKKFKEARNNPSIIHYLGEERPWRKGNTHKYKSDYKKYLNMTVWKDAKDEEGWTLYFICWKIFNVVTKPFPMLRLSIINSLIPKFMNIRSKKVKKEIKK